MYYLLENFYDAFQAVEWPISQNQALSRDYNVPMQKCIHVGTEAFGHDFVKKLDMQNDELWFCQLIAISRRPTLSFYCSVLFALLGIKSVSRS